MALYSVWDWSRNSWRVYSTPKPTSVGDDPTPQRPTNGTALGFDPDRDVPSLPGGAKFVGYSHLARGEVRRVGGGFSVLGDSDGEPFWKQPIVLVGLGAALATLWWRTRRA